MYPGSQATRNAVELHSTTSLIQGLYWERHKGVAASACMRSSKELSRRGRFISGFPEVTFSRVGTGKISNPEHQAIPVIGGISSPGIAVFSERGSELRLFTLHSLDPLSQKRVVQP